MKEINFILENIKELYLTWDIGHELSDDQFNYNLYDYSTRLKNIHAHNYPHFCISPNITYPYDK